MWPEREEFGRQDIEPEQEFMALREVFFANLPRELPLISYFRSVYSSSVVYVIFLWICIKVCVFVWLPYFTQEVAFVFE